MVDDIPAIAMLGPERDPVSPDTLAMAASLGRALVAAGCGVIVSGGGPVATAAGRAEEFVRDAEKQCPVVAP